MRLIFGLLACCFYLVAIVAMIGHYSDVFIYTYLAIVSTIGFLVWKEDCL